jgi:hypothetical protein
MLPNPVLVCSFQAVAVATIYCIWRTYHETVSRRKPDLRERVAYMLWVTANKNG